MQNSTLLTLSLSPSAKRCENSQSTTPANLWMQTHHTLHKLVPQHANSCATACWNGNLCNRIQIVDLVLGLPAILASGFFELYELWQSDIPADEYRNLFLGILSSFIFGYLSIEFLLRFLRTHGTLVFVVYRIALGSAVLFFWWDLK